MGKTDNTINHKRKVILLKCKGKEESLILSKSLDRRIEKLTIKVEFDTASRESENKDDLNETYPIFRAQLKERIVPCCFRAKCAEKYRHIKIPQYQKFKPRDAGQGTKQSIYRKRRISSSSSASFDISDDSHNTFGYDNFNTGSLSPYTDDEIEALMRSTRKRMKDQDDDWQLFPRQHPSSSTLVSNRHLSINSLDTIVLEADYSQEYLDMYELKNEAYSPTSPIALNYEAIYSNKELLHILEDAENLYGNHFQSEGKIDDTEIVEQGKKNLKYKCNNSVNINNNSIKRDLYGDV